MTLLEHWVWAIVCPVLAYFIGAIPFSYIIAKWQTGDDLRETGSKNVGGLNVMIRAGFNWGILAGFLDFAKGLVCVFVVLIIPFDNTPLAGAGKYWEISLHDLIYILVATAVLLGHNYSVFLKFRGGRGIAAATSFLVIANPIILLVYTFSLIILGAITRYVRPSQFLALFVIIPVSFFISISPPWIVLLGMDSAFILGLFVVCISLAIFPKYLQAFINVFKGKEWRLGKTGGVIFADDDSSKEKMD
ncbi:MAG: glycerol-3-phosphate acyltransferase [Asgard group archaeon]|nr:glycerol-3-phosphate acyltransferase [Asgard group archaeon]